MISGPDNSKSSVFLTLYSRHYCSLCSYIMSILLNESDTDDVMQETTITMWNKFGDFELGTDFMAWAKTIARYKVMELRKAKKRSHLQLDAKIIELLEKEEIQTSGSNEDRMAALSECVKKLPEKDRDFIKLKYFQGLTAKKLSTIIGASIATVYRNSARVNALLLGCVERTIKARES